MSQAYPNETVKIVDLLIEQRKILRILQPPLRDQIETAVRQTPSLSSYVTYHDGELYLSLQTLSSAQQREKAYYLIQQYQLDNNTDLQKLPNGLRACLQPIRRSKGRFVGSVVVGALLGVVIGLMGMAVSVLLVAITGFGDEVVGVAITGLSFAVFSTLGWVGATFYLWRIRQSDV